MIFKEHSDLKGGYHALFSPSSSSWLRYDIDKAIDRKHSKYKAAVGTEIHGYSSSKIYLGDKPSGIKQIKNEIRLSIYNKYFDDESLHSLTKLGKILLNELDYTPKEVFSTVRSFVSDAIDFGMTSEQPLVYDKDYFAGTADAISFWNDTLRIHDLKTGAIPADMEQLEVYAALFCLEYKILPRDISIELRIYQNDEVLCFSPGVDDIVPIIDKIVYLEKALKQNESDEEGY